MGLDLGTGMSKNLGVEAATAIGGIDTDMGTGVVSGIGMCIDQGIGVGLCIGRQSGGDSDRSESRMLTLFLTLSGSN